MLQRLIQRFKVEIKAKDIAAWFALSFVTILLIYLGIMKRSLDLTLLIETLGVALVFVLMMIGTKSYGHFVDDFYQSNINRHNQKNARKNAKRSKSR